MSAPLTPVTSRSRRWWSSLPALLAGLVLFVFWAALGEAAPSYRIKIEPPFTHSSTGELFLWLTHTLVALPAAVLVGMGVGPWLESGWKRARRALASATRVQRAALVTCLVVATAVSLIVVRSLFLLDLPVTDDESGVTWGGEVLARGRLGVIPPGPTQYFRGPYQIQGRAGLMSFEWPGGLLFNALSHVTHLGSRLYAALAATTAPLMALAAWQLWGRRAGLLAGAWTLTSPSLVLLALTTHTQLVSRSLFAATLAAYAVSLRREGRFISLLTGLLLGSAWVTRPIELSFLATPLVVRELWLAARTRQVPRMRWAMMVLGFLPSVFVFGLCNRLLTGFFWLPARFHPEIVAYLPTRHSWGYWDRLGEGVAYTSLLLVLFAIGLPGALLAASGVSRRGARGEPAGMSLALAGSVLAALTLSMVHDDFGVHPVGPIHQAEVTLLLLLLATRGAVRLRALARRRSLLSEATMLGATAGYLVLGHGALSIAYLDALHRQAIAQQTPYAALDRAQLPLSVVLTPSFRSVYTMSPELEAGSWVRLWHPVRPDLSDRYLLLHDLENAEQVMREIYPDRALYRLSFRPSPDPLEVVQLERLDTATR